MVIKLHFERRLNSTGLKVFCCVDLDCITRCMQDYDAALLQLNVLNVQQIETCGIKVDKIIVKTMIN